MKMTPILALLLLAACGVQPTIPTPGPADMAVRPDLARLVCPAPLLDCTDAPGCETHGDTDSQNCGNCGEICPPIAHGNTFCAQSSCMFACAPPWMACGPGPVAHCDVNTDNDPKNCGGCGHVCGAGQVCQNGTCA